MKRAVTLVAFASGCTIVSCEAVLGTGSLADRPGGPAGSLDGSAPTACEPAQTECSGTTPQTCGMNGQWQAGTACVGTTPFCLSGSCSANPPSCLAGGRGLTNCGSASESCCTSLKVTGGPYYRTYTNGGGGATALSDQATVSDFLLDRYLVTVGRFREFVVAWNNGRGWTPLAGSGTHTHLNGGHGLVNSGPGGGYETGWAASDDAQIAPTTTNLECDVEMSGNFSTWTDAAGDHENLPINCLNWWEAYAFCIWDGGFLPSEAEWEFAAAAGAEQREYPWGSAAPGTMNQYAIYNCDYPSGSGNCTSFLNIAPVGTATLGAGAWGHLDLAGNLYEWNLDWKAPYASCTDCADLVPPSSSATSNVRLYGGGMFSDDPSELLPSNIFGSQPALRSEALGVRCGRAP